MLQWAQIQEQSTLCCLTQQHIKCHFIVLFEGSKICYMPACGSLLMPTCNLSSSLSDSLYSVRVQLCAAAYIRRACDSCYYILFNGRGLEGKRTIIIIIMRIQSKKTQRKVQSAEESTRHK